LHGGESSKEDDESSYPYESLEDDLLRLLQTLSAEQSRLLMFESLELVLQLMFRFLCELFLIFLFEFTMKIFVPAILVF
jgi:hypothetical protein